MNQSSILIPFGQQPPTQWLAQSAPVLAAAGIREAVVIGPEAESLRPPTADLKWSFRSENRPFSGHAWEAALTQITGRTLFFVNPDAGVVFRADGLARMAALSSEAGTTILYSDYLEDGPAGLAVHPSNVYQLGSVRDNFDFGPVVAIDMTRVRAAREQFGPLMDTEWSGWYDLRLRLSALALPVHLPEALYRASRLDARPVGQQQFDYQDPRHRAVQVEMEHVATQHLKHIGAYLEPEFAAPPPSPAPFPVEASVIIPVRNRVKTTGDAVRSALAQVAPFAFNVIVVDNHSTDGTTDMLRQLAGEDQRLVHLIPDRTDLGIGGCWNYGVQSAHCGRITVQLDSDDIYSGPDTLVKIVAAFATGPYAVVVGSYSIVDFSLKPLPPGLIDHREWTRENGRNNLLRVNGLGAPRAFLTHVLRANPLPDVSYGEDYAIGLRLSREYEIGRIYDSLYLCRRWEGNSDSDPPIALKNQHDTIKDRVRTLEILARQRMNAPTTP